MRLIVTSNYSQMAARGYLADLGPLVARDGDRVWVTPYDDCVMVMPSLIHLKPGTTMVRLGQYAD